MPDYRSASIRDEYRFPIEELAVRRFAEAAWDDSPRFCLSGGSAAGDVPLMFGCLGATLTGRVHPLESVGFDVARSFHGEETILLYSPLRTGTTLLVRDATLRLPDLAGRRGGAMHRTRRRSLLVDEAGDVVGVVTRTMLETANPLIGSAPTEDASLFDDGLRVRADPVDAQPTPLRAVRSGQTLPFGEFGPLTRADFVRYSAASGDLTSIHYDENAARSRGYRTTFAMGMLSAAFIGHMVTDWFELEYPCRLSVRFQDQVWPGDTLVITGDVVTADEKRVIVTIRCRSGRGPATTAVLEHWRPGAPAPGPDDY